MRPGPRESLKMLGSDVWVYRDGIDGEMDLRFSVRDDTGETWGKGSGVWVMKTPTNGRLVEADQDRHCVRFDWYYGEGVADRSTYHLEGLVPDWVLHLETDPEAVWDWLMDVLPVEAGALLEEVAKVRDKLQST